MGYGLTKIAKAIFSDETIEAFKKFHEQGGVFKADEDILSQVKRHQNPTYTEAAAALKLKDQNGNIKGLLELKNDNKTVKIPIKGDSKANNPVEKGLSVLKSKLDKYKPLLNNLKKRLLV